MPIPSDMSLEMAAKWVSGFTVLMLGIRQALKTMKADERDRRIIEAEIAQLERIHNEMAEKCTIITNLRKQVHDLDVVERQASPDVALIGEYLRQLKDRPCEIAEDGKCPAQVLCERFEELYRKIEARRVVKNEIFSRRITKNA